MPCLDEKLDIFLAHILFTYCFIVDVMRSKEIYIKTFNCFEIRTKSELSDSVTTCFNCIATGLNMTIFISVNTRVIHVQFKYTTC